MLRKRNEGTIAKGERKPALIPTSESYDKEMTKMLLDWKIPSISDGSNGFLATMLFTLLQEKKRNES